MSEYQALSITLNQCFPSISLQHRFFFDVDAESFDVANHALPSHFELFLRRTLHELSCTCVMVEARTKLFLCVHTHHSRGDHTFQNITVTDTYNIKDKRERERERERERI